MTPIEAAQNLLDSGKITQNQFIRICSMESQDLQIAAVSAVTEFEFREEIRKLREKAMDLKIFVSRRQVARDLQAGLGDVFGLLLQVIK